MSEHASANFDVRPPGAVADYDTTAQRVNPGYALAFELAAALLRAHCPADAELLVVGAGGGAEVRAFGAAAPGWRLTGVDPSANMLALARAKAEAAGLAGRVRLVQGTVDDLAPAARFHAATAMYVLMHLPDDGAKLRLLQGVARRLQPGAPLLLVDSAGAAAIAVNAGAAASALATGLPASAATRASRLREPLSSMPSLPRLGS
jgi:tRNA (cmo5U34)-methyltransferase